jgi:hypothetical protein
METVSKLSAKERADLFRESAIRRGDITPEIVEKDFWVCWMLKHIFSLHGLSAHLIFKGGTSLSKVFKVIKRFSEDIDLSFSRSDFGFTGDRDIRSQLGTKKRERLLKELKNQCESYIATEFLPYLIEDVSNSLGSAKDSGWEIYVDQNDPQTILFSYPTGITDSEIYKRYIQPSVRLELGARSDDWPATDDRIKPYAAEEFPDLFEDALCPVHVLRAERTFWEKATLLHSEYHRPIDKATGERLSRHYYDLAFLAAGPYGKGALDDVGLLSRVVEHKRLFFRSGWAHYESAKPGSFHILPPEDRIPMIRSDYDKMKEMIFGPPPDFNQILDVLRGLEDRINGISK